MEIKSLSGIFHVRRLGTEDVQAIYALSSGNELFYQYHPPFVTRESIWDDMHALPPGKDDHDKYYVGFFERDTLVAVMDLILGYPQTDIAFIGLFMVNLDYQGKGIGSRIVCECMAYLKSEGYKKIRLGTDKENPQSNAFWKKNGFTAIGEGEYICMEAVL
ncbi:MAG: GNAT family N-acetyltransferase [Oscillospiraceae bacterium]